MVRVYCVQIFSFTGNLGDYLNLYYLGNVMGGLSTFFTEFFRIFAFFVTRPGCIS